ncbi:hypothetical protein CIB84_005756 [Bambusicola thoracicus]|uniref:Uncharacterized protein n=1 Tax=Bambusicola thoracicus TaxID=9083 RepID=A0A2P4T2A6_BAMTH|nr:hypothetical protein CIB84_005756 [Bambusicola thoracicus]
MAQPPDIPGFCDMTNFLLPDTVSNSHAFLSPAFSWSCCVCKKLNPKVILVTSLDIHSREATWQKNGTLLLRHGMLASTFLSNKVTMKSLELLVGCSQVGLKITQHRSSIRPKLCKDLSLFPDMQHC